MATSAVDRLGNDTAAVAVISAASASVVVSPQEATVTTGGSLAFSATLVGPAPWPSQALTWSVLEDGGGSIDDSGDYTAPGTPGTYHVIAASVVHPATSGSATVYVLPVASAPMPLISRLVPATSSAGTAAWAQDNSYGGIDWHFHMADIGGQGWVVYNLSGVPAAQRQNILVALYLSKGDPYYQLNYRAASSYTPEFVPSAYVLEGATSPSGPWTALVAVGTNNNQFKSHSLNFSGYAYLRFRSTSGPYGCRVKIDVYNASGGISDGIVFYGDSIAANIFQSGSSGFPPEWFSKQIQASSPAFFPFVLGGGYPYTTARDAVDLIVTDSGRDFTTGLPSPLGTIFSAAKYAALIFGANDAPAPDLVSSFRSSYAQIINALRSQDQTVVLASPTWATGSARQAGLVRIRAAIGFHLPDWSSRVYSIGEYVWNRSRAYLCTTTGTSVSGPTGTGSGISDGGTARWSYVPSLREDFAADPNVIGGPDLYAVFFNHPDWLSDGLHPNVAGEVQWRNAWVNWARSALYR
jgi:hypothetical protein